MSSEAEAATSVQQEVVEVKLLIQTRRDDKDHWHNRGNPYPALFDEAARDYLRLVRTGYPGLQARLIERSVIHSDRVVEG